MPNTNKILILILLALVLGELQAQNNYFILVEPPNKLIDSGTCINFRQFNLGNIDFYNGRKENNLKYFIKDKSNGKILYQRPEELSDAMILKPKFFYNENTKTYILLIEEAAEYSWGQEVLIIHDNNTVKFLGYLDYAVDKGNGESISDYAKIYFDKGKIILAFDDVPLIYYPDESQTINGKDIMFELNSNGIKKLE